MLDFRIDTFLMVCKHMNFTRAAEELNITQPGVSGHIRQLEDSYGVKLFHHEGKKLTLTDAGRLFLETARTMKHDERYLKSRLSLLGGRRRALIFGATLTVGAFVMPAAIARYLKRHPDAPIEMQVANTKELLRRVDDGTIDFAVVEGNFSKHSYDHLTLETDRYIAVCAPDYKFHKPVSTVEDLFGERLLLRESGSGTREILEKHLASLGRSVRDFAGMVEIGSVHAVKQLAKAGCGITFLYEAAVMEELRTGTLKRIDLEDLHVLHAFSFLWRKNSAFSADYHALFAELCERASDAHL
ncbi:LysR family transcriptional regulator [Candidatus Soleaferrea massiliensis]|uniref:LysR family transcriptional regulator n=1 Tax=Candidatus Soleaferrea massiliensis TaxID=1470354 RepID=UPI00058B223A|nr:LysR family transcriptional regulator [Candidatus Soleaferrea massiliensis]